MWSTFEAFVATVVNDHSEQFQQYCAAAAVFANNAKAANVEESKATMVLGWTCSKVGLMKCQTLGLAYSLANHLQFALEGANVLNASGAKTIQTISGYAILPDNILQSPDFVAGRAVLEAAAHLEIQESQWGLCVLYGHFAGYNEYFNIISGP